MKKIVLLILALFCQKGVPALADEGMWVPALIQSRIKDMKAKGFKRPPKTFTASTVHRSRTQSCSSEAVAPAR